MTPRKPSQRFFRALALEPRILLDAAAVTTAAEVAAQAEAPATADAPGVEATPVHSTLTITDSTTSFPPVDLFGSVDVSQETGGGLDELANLVITVDRTGSDQALVIDGKTIELVAGSGTTRANDSGYVYEVSVSGTTTTITLSLNAFDPDPASVATLIDTLSYQALDKSVASGTVTITLHSLSDDGGQTTDLSAIKATVEIDSQVNVPPVISGDVLKEAEALNAGVLAASTEVAYSADGKYVYAAGSNSSISVFEVSDTGSLILKQTLTGIQDLGTVTHMVVSPDGKSVYTASGNGNLVLLSVDADGTLSRNAAIAVGDSVTGSLAISDDGTQLFVGSQWNGLYVYSRDTDSGALTQLQRLDGRSGIVTTSGDYVYVTYAGAGIVTPPSLSVYQRSASGTLSLVDSLNISATGTDLAASADGRYLYVGSASGVTLYQLGTDNQLTQVNAISGIAVGSLSLDADGDRLFVAASNGTVHLYSVASNGSLTSQGTLSSTTNGQEIAVAPDGQSIVISGNGLSRFSSIQTLIRGEAITLASDLSLSDANFDRLAGGSGDYGGGSLLIERAGGASANDVFGFADGNGLTLANGEILKSGEVIASFTQSGGTLIITFQAGTSRDDANAVLRQVTYANEGSDANGSVVTLQLRVNDGQVDSQLIGLDVLLTQNTAPELNTSSAITAPYDTTGTLVTLFRDTTIRTGEVGQSIIQLTLSIDGLNDVANEFIIISGTRIDLSQSSSGSAGAYSYTYTRTGDSATLVIDSGGINSATAQTLVNGIGYVNDTRAATTGTRTFTLASVRDSGGSAGGGDDTGEPGISASIELAINNAPQWQTDTSEPNPTLYYADGTLSGYADRVTDMLLSADGKTLVISGSTGDNASGTSYLRIYSRDTSTGALTLVQTFTQGASDNPDTVAIEANGLSAISTLAMHGDNLYLAGHTGNAGAYSLVRFTYDANTGEYAYAGIVATQGVDGVTGLDAQVSEIVISADGKSLYTINGVTTIDGATGKSVLAQFAIDAQSGALTYLGAYQGGSADLGMNAPTGIVVSPDGTSVYVSNRSNSMLTVFSRDTDSGALTYVGFINASTITADADSATQPSDNRYLLELQDIVISPDGKYVYVGSGQQATLTIFSRDAADGSLTYAGTLSLYSSVNTLAIREIAMSSDGSALYVGFNGGVLAVLSRDSVTGAVAFVSSLNVGARSNQIAVTPDGLNIYTGRSQFTTGVAILSALPTASYVANRASTPFAEGVSFADVDFDAAGSYQGAELTISRSGSASVNDLFGFKDGSGLTLVNNQIQQNGTAIAEFSSADGKLTIRFIAAVDKATANQVLQQVTYRNDSAETPARVELKLSVDDGGKSSDTTLVLLLSAPEPVLSANGNTTSITIGGSSLPGQVDLFEQVSVSLGEDGEVLSELIISVDRSGTDQALIIDGSTVVLQAGSGQTSANGYAYVVEVDTGGTRVRLSLAGSASAQDAATLIDGIAYQALADTVSAGTVTITLASLSDTSDQIEPGISASVTVRDQRQLPSLGADVGALDYADLLTQLDDNGNNLLQGVQGITAIGDKVYVVRSSSDWVYDEATQTGSEVAINTLSVYQRAADGTLQLLETQTVSGLTGIATLHVSTDGGTLYLIGADGIALFNAADLQQLGTFGADIGLVSDVVAQGDKVYVTADSKLLVFTRSDNSLTLEQTLEDAGDSGMQLDGANAISLSPDGRTLYVATSGGNTLVSVFSIATDGSLSFRQAVAGTDVSEFGHYASALDLSADGKTLYVIDNNALLHVLDVGTDGNLTAAATLELGSGDDISVKDVIVSPDGKTLLVIGNLGSSESWNSYGVFLYSRGEDGALTLVQKVEGFGDYANFAGTTFNEIRHAALSADGTQLYLTGIFVQSGWNEGVLVIDLKPASLTFTEDGEAVAILPGGTLSDPQLDTTGDYQGASLVITREGGAQSDDAFSFLAGNGLELKDDGTIWKGSSAIATFVEANGTLTISFLAGVSQVDAQLVLRQVAYSSSSNDPERAGSNATFKIVFDDGENNQAQLDASVTLEGINDPAVVSTSPLNPTYSAGGEPVRLFENTHVDTVETGQGIWKVQVILSGSAAGDVLGIGDEQISDLSSQIGKGVQTLPSGQSYNLYADGDTVVIDLFMPEGSGTPLQTQALIDSLSYASESTAPEGTRTIGLRVIEDDYSTRSSFSEQATVNLESNAAPIANAGNFSLVEATAGQRYSVQLPADLFSDADNDTLTWVIDGLPTGLSFDPLTRTLSGTVQAMGSHELTLKVSDGRGGEAEMTLTLEVVNAVPVASGSFALGSINTGQAYEVTLAENLFNDANDSELTWTISNLPEWLSFDADTRTLSGTAPDVVGSHVITLIATDPHGATATLTLTLTVAQPPTQTAGDTVAPIPSSGFQQQASALTPASFGGPALNAPLFEYGDAPASDLIETAALTPPPSPAQALLQGSQGSGLADGRGSLSEQLANSDGVLTDSGLQATASSFSFDGTTLRSDVDLNQNPASRSIELRLPVATAEGASAQRVTLANGLPLPSWARFDVRSGELRIDRERLPRDGVLRLTLISRDAEGKEQRTPVEVRATQAPANAERAAPQVPTAQVESLPERLRQDTSSALLSEALDLLDQLSDLAAEPAAATRHIA